MSAVEQSKLKKLIIKDKDGSEVHIEKETAFHPPVSTPEFSSYEERRPAHGYHPVGEAKESAAAGTYISSPLVGTFYESPSPEDPPFIKVGDSVDENTVVCIVEAMKVMNEVKAGMKGVIKEILVDNGQPVEFGTKLFLIE